KTTSALGTARPAGSITLPAKLLSDSARRTPQARVSSKPPAITRHKAFGMPMDILIGPINLTPDASVLGRDSRNCSAWLASRGDVCDGTGISIVGSRAELSIHPFATS